MSPHEGMVDPLVPHIVVLLIMVEGGLGVTKFPLLPLVQVYPVLQMPPPVYRESGTTVVPLLEW